VDTARLEENAVGFERMDEASRARIGPVVCADEGPSPMRYKSKALTNIPRFLHSPAGDLYYLRRTGLAALRRQF
jgi:hypothetical protein